MGNITKVALAGATGNLGPAILTQLINAGFKVTVLTRNSSTHTFPPSVTAIPVDYDSLDSLTTALSGQEALVSTLGFTALTAQLLLIEAAAKAHIKRFIPSEFGSNTLNAKVRRLPVFADKVKIQDALEQQAAASTGGGMTYTLICTGPFLDWGIKAGLLMNLKAKRIELLDGGDRPFSATSLATIGKAVAGVLTHLERTRDRAVFVQDAAVSSTRLAAMGKEAVGAEGWEESVVPVDEVLGRAWAELRKEEPDPHVFAIGFIKAVIMGEGYGSLFETLDNELLGLGQMSDADLKGLVNELAQ